MKKLINDPGAFVDEMLEGILLAHPDRLRAVGAGRALDRPGGRARARAGSASSPAAGPATCRCSSATSGVGLCSGVAVGNVFSSPSMDQILRGDPGVDGGAGVLYLYGNYGGDVLNFDLAGELADAEGIDGRDRPRRRRRRLGAGRRGRRAAGRRRDVLRVQVRGCGGRRRRVARRRSRRRPGTPLAGTRSMGVGAVADDPAGRRQADLRAGRRRDGDRHRHPRRARRPARAARDRRRDRRRPARGDRGRPGAAAAATASRSSSTASARRRSRSCTSSIAASTRDLTDARRGGASAVHRRVRDEPRDGRRVAHRDARRRPDRRLARRAGRARRSTGRDRAVAMTGDELRLLLIGALAAGRRGPRRAARPRRGDRRRRPRA